MYSPDYFKKKLMLSSCISLAISSGATPSLADEIQEVTITGYRASLKTSMEQKREASGIQDVITAEDIGKFPDTNLAESLQRVPGVSINREGGEGSRVSVRGLDAQYNLVTHNGRTIASTTGDRSFNFADIPAELVAAVAVYKTSNASIDSGGMGATIDYRSIRPLATPAERGVVSAKAIADTSWHGGNTPEVFGLYSNTFNDDTLGVSVALGYQQREDSLARAHIDSGWRTIDLNPPMSGNAEEAAYYQYLRETSSALGVPTSATSYSVPQSARYKFESTKRERVNGQLVLQWKPIDSITTTLDYDEYQRTVNTERNEISSWFTFPSNAGAVWNSNRGVTTPTVYSETYIPIGNPLNERLGDIAMAGGETSHQFSGKSVGLNLAWVLSDKLKVTLDASHSSAEDAPNNPLGSDITISTAAYKRTSTSLALANDKVFSVINGGEDVTPSDMQIGGSIFGNTLHNANVDQLKASGNFNLNDENSIDFGIVSTEVFNRNRRVNVQQNNWSGLGSPGEVSTAFEGTEASTRDRFSTGFAGWNDASQLPQGATLSDGTHLLTAKPMDTFFDWRLPSILAAASDRFGALVTSDTVPGDCGTAFCASTAYDAGTDQQTIETTRSLYAQYHFTQSPFQANLGLRYEKTEVESTAVNIFFTNSAWAPDDATVVLFGQNSVYNTKTASYSKLLPNLDLNYKVTDNIILRSSFSKTIARAGYDMLASNLSLGSIYSRTRGYATGSEGDPSLKPFESTNMDMSAEWYYGDTSYASLGIFTKKVRHFIATETDRRRGVFANGMTAIHDPLRSHYVTEAISALGTNASGQAIRTYIFDHHDGEPSVTRFPGTNDFQGIIFGQPTDPLTEFEITKPNNSGEDRKITGYEFALQHLIGESGYGIQLNVTSVFSDLDWDVTNTRQDQTPLLGISDSANLVMFYDKNNWNLRLCYNWRDKYLSSYNDEGGQSPVFTNAYYQIDVGLNYLLTENLKISLDGINITANPYVSVARDALQIHTFDETGARWMLGASYSF